MFGPMTADDILFRNLGASIFDMIVEFRIEVQIRLECKVTALWDLLVKGEPIICQNKQYEEVHK